MAAITAAMVKDLREQSGAGMMDCKKALAECDGDMDAAFELLRKNGAAKAEKKASRIAAEGICKVVVEGNTAVVLEVNSETDFVAKNEKFQTYVEKVAKQILNSNVTTIDELLAEKWAEDSSKTVNDVHVEMVATIGEKLSLRRFEKVTSDGFVVSYTHGGGRIGVIVDMAGAESDAAKEAATNLAMQIAALNPKYVSRSEVSAEYIAHEKEILLAQIMNDPKESQKPEKVINGMIEGRVSKELKEICLLDQVYVKAEDGKQSVAKYLEQVSKETGSELSVKRFVRFETGEGLEKKNEDFAAEVAAQMNA
ncbi:MAG: elongation factor Ts [Pseudobutyrivibrio sp.]|jgi:elongation factor Ts|uniref:Elongation factor Ts n=2 Tax=Pseudobutyrivibrio TaxID=46205 RepID=A0A2G3DV15_9FIRM|nr:MULTISPECIES: translation elongation factor Ts [Pseudobutyrivibrio]MBE5902762.1 elongation factor Ts [Pseudobutyrivibrio sp.]NEX01014.1 elongation factor Ts [Pseudobutyrivibrio xylanivorans]PHU34907.1 elongation factor Ts [Pseudobutyrivibrio ruminis]PHU40023.1 elongation factor Ts [Pseudobutyrivibrio ruminis]SCX86255.1 elongation factor Ts [Pseudobutyrivibrio sp. AR14]